MLKYSLLFGALALSACTTAGYQTNADGSRDEIINCGAWGYSMCYSRADDLCPFGYEKRGERFANSMREVVVRCNKPTALNVKD